MVRYTAEEYANMIRCYERSGQNARAASRLYRQLFARPNRFPGHRVILGAVRRFEERQEVIPYYGENGGHNAMDMRVENRIMAAVTLDPTTSTRAIGRELGLSNSAVHRVLKYNNLHPFHYRKVQELYPNDYPRRQDFCRWLLNMVEGDGVFVNKIFFTDECLFTKEGMFNTRNFHHWSEENPRLVRQCRSQRRWKINIWAAIYGNRLYGPYVLGDYLNGENYRAFIRNDVVAILENLNEEDRNSMYFMQDGAPAHRARQTADLLNEMFPNRWIGINGPFEWPPRSPDANPLDFFLWWRIKEIVYKTPCNTREECLVRIRAAFRTVRQEELDSLSDQIKLRCNLCIANEGRHFENVAAIN